MHSQGGPSNVITPATTFINRDTTVKLDHAVAHTVTSKDREGSRLRGTNQSEAAV